ncbi:cytosol aminopeptidase family, catalytic domain-containing protein [Phthorimaea operculella]|nr:cytosol aminopeptidase family, catalytic domain-containing protein [Phthorimaea operculella]
MALSKLLSSVIWIRNQIYLSRVCVRACSGGGGGAGGAPCAGGAPPAAAGAGSCPSPSSSVDDCKPQGASKPCAVVCVFGKPGAWELSDAARKLDQESGGKLSTALNECSGRLETGRALVVSEPTPELCAAALAVVGRKDAGYDVLEHLEVFRENVRVGVGAGVVALKPRSPRRLLVDGCGAPDAAAEGASLAAWRFQEFKSCEMREPEPEVSLLAGGEGDEQTSFTEGVVRARGQNWARFLSDMPANKMTPVDLAQHALDVLCPLGVKVEARDADWIRTQDMQAFLAVARGSCEAPMFLEASYDGPGAPATQPVLIAAKGVTFDSGGLCLKRPQGMVENRGSMAGCAVALGAIRALAELKVPCRVRLVAPLCENMVSGQCMKVGDVVRALNGLSIQIENTDMEGRLMMSDALVYGQARHKPALVIDVATLTHGVLLATGGGAFGCFTNSEAAWRLVQASGARSGDRAWRFPLWSYYHNQLTNDMSVDLRNKGSSKAAPCLGAAFLRNFVCGDWVHWDITGVGKLAHAPAPPYLDPRRMTGRPTRTLDIPVVIYPGHGTKMPEIAENFN